MKFLNTAAILLMTSAIAATAQTTTPPENLYLIGSATTAQWNANEPIAMEKVNAYEFTYTGPLTIGEFKMPWVKGDPAMWGNNTYMASGDASLKSAGINTYDCMFTTNGQPDQKWKVFLPGTYKLTLKINPDDITSAKLTAECLSLPDKIYAFGAAPDQWNSYGGVEVPSKENGIYICSFNMNYSNENKQIKFFMPRGEWNAVSYIVPTEVDHYSGNGKLGDDGSVKLIEPGKSYPFQVSFVGNGPLDWFWGIQENRSGKYEVIVNIKDKTVTFNLLKSYVFDKDNVTELYMLGLAAESFDSNNPLKMNSLGNGKFSWTGNLDYSTDDGIADHANKQFKFVTSTGEWNEVHYLVPTDADANGFTKEVESGESYTMKMTTFINGGNGVDAFFGLKPNDKGKYTITADVPNMSFAITKDSSVGVFEIEASGADAVEEIYDLSGRRVSRESVAPGVYIIRKGMNVKKVVIK